MPTDRNGSAALPPPPLGTGTSLATALAGRRSVRGFAAGRLTHADVGALLWAAQGITSEDGLRAAPSAGALYPLTVHVAVDDGLYRYVPAGHRIVHTSAADLRVRLSEAASDQHWVGQAPAVFAISADVSRSARRYGGRAERYVLLEAGHAAQNLLLQAVALGLNGVPVGAFDDEAVHGLLALSRKERPVYLLPVGRPPETGEGLPEGP